MTLSFVEQFFRQHQIMFSVNTDGSIKASIPGTNKMVFNIALTETTNEVAQAETWLPPLNRPVKNIEAFCRYFCERCDGVEIQFDKVSSKLQITASFEKDDLDDCFGPFLLVCDFGLNPLWSEMNNRGAWTPALVDAFLTYYPTPTIN